MLQQFFQRHLPTGADTSTVCAVFALLLPAEDNRRYHLKESRLAQAVVTALGLGGSFAAQRLQYHARCSQRFAQQLVYRGPLR